MLGVDWIRPDDGFEVGSMPEREIVRKQEKRDPQSENRRAENARVGFVNIHGASGITIIIRGHKNNSFFSVLRPRLQSQKFRV